jgi:Pretoxin HINT domain/Hemerythrin HHE cation binding domain
MTSSQTGQDVVDVLVSDHRDVTALIGEIRSATDPMIRRDLTDTAISELVRHAVAEEMYVYPAMRKYLADGEKAVEHDVEEHKQLERIDPDTGERTAEPVLTVLVTDEDKHLVDLTLDGDDSDVLTATDQHPIWVVGKGWTFAGNVKRGEAVLGADGNRAMVTGTTDRGWAHRPTVYNLNVGDVHTYVVGVGNDNLAVHNSSCSNLGNADWRHIYDRHVNPRKFLHKSKFLTGNKAKIERMINTTVHRGSVVQKKFGRTVHEHDFGRSIGRGRKGTPSTRMRVVCTRNGRVKTAYPSMWTDHGA